METQTDTDVLIVGSGPVGLFLANECVRRGMRWRLIELRPGQTSYSKALAIMPRTLEILDMAGLAEPFLEVANRVTEVAVISHRRRLARLHFAPEQSPYQFIAMVPQDVTERLLVQALERRGGVIEYETRFLSARQEDDRVLAEVEHQGQRSTITAAYVVGCDGPHSTVRHLLDLPFEGAQYDATYLLADVESDTALPSDEMQLCPSEKGPVAIFPMSQTRRRVLASVDTMEGPAPSVELVHRILEERGPGGLDIQSMSWSSYFRIHHRQVARLRVARIFVAGDAGHIHSPVGGQGMNTGLQDIWNLVWKLDLAVRGLASEELLDSYSAERRPVIKQVIETTDRLTKAMTTPSRVAQLLRDAIIPMVSRLAPFQHAFVQRMSELDVAYPGSPIIEGEGRRYFDPSMVGGDGIRNRYLIFLPMGAEAWLIEAARQFVEARSPLVELRQGREERLVLVRPDGYAAYEEKHPKADSSWKAIGKLIDRGTRRQTVGR